ncbi:CBS domain-containing protein [Methylomonas koyamae]|nr:CBS domain-containing protein [Methylomonas koyamae]
MKVAQIMSKQVQCCRPTDSLEHVAQLMWDKDCGCLPVCGGGMNSIVGMITDRDIVMCAMFQGKPLRELQVAEAMAREVRTCHPNDALAVAEKIMRDAKIRRLPVIDKSGCVVGMISLADLAQEAVRENSANLKDISPNEVSDTLATICTPDIRQLAA